MAHFNKRHYEAIAQAIQSTKVIGAVKPIDLTREDQWYVDFAALATMFDRDNSLFDKVRFLHACLPGSNVKAKTAHLKTDTARADYRVSGCKS